jgi:hypothetical protein
MSEHVREHRSVLAAAEKRLLIRIATRMPTAIHSDHLTALALAAMAVAGLSFAVAGWDRRALWVVIGALAVNWFGDSLDGTLARVRRQERPRYGFYVDHVVDIVGITMLMAGLAASGFMAPLCCRPRCSSRPRFTASSGCRSPASGPRSCASCWRPAPWRSSAIRMSILVASGG